MKIISGRIVGQKFKLHRIKNGKGRYTSGSIVLLENNGQTLVLKRGEHIGVQDMIMIVELSTWQLYKLLVWSLVGIKEHKIQ